MRILTIAVLLLITSFARGQELPYINHTEAGILVADGRQPSFTAQTFNGVKINKWKLEAGITAGVDIYPEMTLLPLAAGLKWNPFNTHAVSPYLSVNAGYGFGWLERQSDNVKYDGGYFLHPSLGLRIKTKNSTQVYLGMGFRRQKAIVRQNNPVLHYDYISAGQVNLTKEEYKFRRLSLTFGISL